MLTMSQPNEPPAPSSRVALEVALLTGSAHAQPQPPRRGTLLVLVDVTDSDVAAYVRDCLRTRTDLRVIDDASTVEHLRPDLVISDRVHGDPTRPLVVLREDELEAHPARSAMVEVLQSPFNARQLLRAVERLIGPAQ
jgi:hypothetical protein